MRYRFWAVLPAAAFALSLGGCAGIHVGLKPAPSVTDVEVKPVELPATDLGSGSLSPLMLLRGGDIARADLRHNWRIESGPPQTPHCGPAITRRPDSRARLMASFVTDDGDIGGQWLTEYDDPAAAVTAYKKFIGAIRLCPAPGGGTEPGQTLSEDRPLRAAVTTRLLRWTDDEDYGLSHTFAVTRKSRIVSVTVLQTNGEDIKWTAVEDIARTAGFRLP